MDTRSTWWTPEGELDRYQTATRQAAWALGDLEPLFLERIQGHRYDLSFLHASSNDLNLWRTTALRALRDGLRLPATGRLDEQRILTRTETADHVQEEIEFRCQTRSRIPATVLVPGNRKPPFPAVVVLHDMGGLRPFGREKMFSFDGEPAYLTAHRAGVYEGKSVCRELVKRGFLTICIDALIFGERGGFTWKASPPFRQARLEWNQEQANQFSREVALLWDRAGFASAILTGQTWAGLIVQEDLATVDYLLSRGDVDPDRIGCVGLSFGAYRTNYLAALDERIKAAVSVCWMATLDSVIGYNVAGAMGFFTLIPGVNTRLDVPDIASLACPRAFLALSGWRDQLMQPHGITSAHRLLRKIWTKAGTPETLGSLCYDAPHEFNGEMQEQAYRWFARHLLS